jgi:chromosome segregation ATPase
MSTHFTVFSRIGQWFAGRTSDEAEQALPAEAQTTEFRLTEQLPARVAPSRPSIFRPWARRDAAIVGLQQGVASLSALMDAIRENLERQSHRQDQMLAHLAHLPEILQSLPDSQRLHGETLKTIGQQLEQQVVQQQQLTEILSRVSDAGSDQKHLLEALHERANTLSEHNEAISENLRQVGSAMETVGRNAESNTQLLHQFREQQASQQEAAAEQQQAMADLVRQQGKRFTLLMVVTIVLAVAALAGAGVVSYLLLNRPM